MGKKPRIKASQNKAKRIETPQLPRKVQQQANHRQALRFLDNVAALSPVSRQTHIQAQQALQQIGAAVDELARLKQTKKE